MNASARNMLQKIGLGMVLAAAGLGVIELVRPPAKAPAAAPRRSSIDERHEAPRMDREAAPLASRVEATTSVEVPEGEAFARSIAEALLPEVGRDGAVREALRAARAGELDPVSLGVKLHETLVDRPAAAAALVPELVGERRPAIALKLAQALAEAQDDPDVRRATIDALAAADPAARAVGLLALLGRGEPEALGLAARSFRYEAPDAPQAADARATAGFILNGAPEGVPEDLRAGVLEAARAALRDPSSPDRLREEALGLLGRPGCDDADLALIERALLDGPEATVRGRALRALVATEAPRAHVRPVLERALALDRMPEELRGAIRAFLATI